jgi:segregation and condensation protein B
MQDLFLEESLEDVIYSILFVAGEGIEVPFISEKLEVDHKTVLKAIDKLEKRLSEKSGVHLIKFNNKIQLSSNPNYANYISSVLNPIREKALTRATLETLAIVAYKQPITRLEVEEIRGVNSDYTIQFLLENKMIEVVGKKDAVGKPLLFGTTEEFLKRFGLSDLSELPNNEELLERIQTIYVNEENSALFNNYKISEEKPEESAFRKSEEKDGLSIEEIDAKIKSAMENINFKLPKEEVPNFLKNETNLANVE